MATKNAFTTELSCNVKHLKVVSFLVTRRRI